MNEKELIEELKKAGYEVEYKERQTNGRLFPYVQDKTTKDLLGKQCNTCHEFKEFNDFYKHKGRWGGIQACCKICTSYYHERNREEKIRNMRDYYQENKERMNEQSKRNQKLRRKRKKNREAM